jgi:hypothetical protein
MTDCFLYLQPIPRVRLEGEILMLVPEIADGFRATIGALRSLDESEGVSFHNFSLPEDRCLRLLLKNLGKRMPEAEIPKELEALHINVQAVMQLRSKRRDQDPEKDRPLTPLFIVSVARGPESAPSHRSLRPASKGGDV